MLWTGPFDVCNDVCTVGISEPKQDHLGRLTHLLSRKGVRCNAHLDSTAWHDNSRYDRTG